MPATSEVSCTTGQSIPFIIEISNQSPSELTDLLLSIQFYQDYQNGTTKYQLETRVALSGPNKWVLLLKLSFQKRFHEINFPFSFHGNSRMHIKSLRVNETIAHQCSAIFFTAGRFKTSIECNDLSKSCTDVNAIVQSYALNTIDDEKIDSQVWRYIPAPEITVIEQT